MVEHRAVPAAETDPVPADPAAPVIAGWLIAVDPGQTAAVRTVVDRLVGMECRGEPEGRLVVVTESAADDLERVHQQLLAVRGVRDAAMVAVYEV